MIRLYDTKQHKKVPFIPLHEGEVRMYVCGPTVYNRIHIGNARTFISFDMIRRYLEWRGFKVTFVQNVTDVDDKIINRAAEEGRSAAEVATEYTKAFIADMHAAGVADPTIRPKATEEIPAMIDLVQALVDKEHAYVVDGDVYFSVRSDPHYGTLSGRNIDEMESGHRELRADGQGLEDRKRDHWISRCGKQRSRESLLGIRPGAKGVRDGTSSAQPCPISIWGFPSISTVAARTWCSRIMRTSAPSLNVAAGPPSRITGCILACCR